MTPHKQVPQPIPVQTCSQLLAFLMNKWSMSESTLDRKLEGWEPYMEELIRLRLVKFQILYGLGRRHFSVTKLHNFRVSRVPFQITPAMIGRVAKNRNHKATAKARREKVICHVY